MPNWDLARWEEHLVGSAHSINQNLLNWVQINWVILYSDDQNLLYSLTNNNEE